MIDGEQFCPCVPGRFALRRRSGKVPCAATALSLAQVAERRHDHAAFGLDRLTMKPAIAWLASARSKAVKSP